jgi:S-(hydroxymethyl)glutathione dehydrogenase/alcohol dehydrogenase
MRAAVMRQPNVPLKIEEVNVQDPKPGEVVVRIAASGICGSERQPAQGLLWPVFRVAMSAHPRPL